MSTEESTENEERIEMEKLTNQKVDALKGKLLEVRKIGAFPIFVSLDKKDTLKEVCEKADVEYKDATDVKCEALKPRGKKWEPIEMDTIVYPYQKVAITTKVDGN